MRGRRLLLALLGAVALGACGKYGPPERAERPRPAAPVAAQPAAPVAAQPAAAPEPPSEPGLEPEQEEQRR